jgi:hypothetical protein
VQPLISSSRFTFPKLQYVPWVKARRDEPSVDGARIPPTDLASPRAATRVEREPAGPRTLTPYIVVSDARRAMDWYVEVFGAQRGA